MDLPAMPEIDRTRAGVLLISPSALGDLLGLSAALEVSPIWRAESAIAVLVEGADMPKLPTTGIPERVTLLCRVVTTEDGRQTVYASWAHRPGREWIISDRIKDAEAA